MKKTNDNEISDIVSDASPQPSQRHDFTQISRQSPIEFCLAAYEDECGYKDNSYLIPYPLEGYYDRRREFTTHTNFFRPIVDAMVDPVFDASAKRALSINGQDYNNNMWEGFLDNCDRSGLTLHEFMEFCAKYMRALSTVFIVVDNVGDIEQERTIAVQKRQYPYVYMKLPTQVHQYKRDMFGHFEEVSFYEREAKVNDKMVWIVNKWTKTELNVLHVGMAGDEEHVETFTHNLGYVPVVTMTDSVVRDKTMLCAKPALYNLARIDNAYYQRESELTENFRKLCFAILTLPDDGRTDVVMGPGTALKYPPDSSNSPQFIAPPGEIFSSLENRLQAVQENLYRVAKQNGVIGVRQAASGVALQYDFRAFGSTLKKTAAICESAEIKIFGIFRDLSGEMQNVVYSPNYSNQYLPQDEEQRAKLDEIILDHNPPTEFESKIMLDWFKRRFPHEGAEAFGEMEKAITKHYEEAAIENAQIKESMSLDFTTEE